MAANGDLTRANYEAWNDGMPTGEWVERCCAEDCRWEAVADLPDSEVYVGRSAITEMIDDSLVGNFGRFRLELAEMAENAAGVMLAFRIVGEGQRGGVPVDIPVFHAHELADGRWTRVAAFLDRESALADIGMAE